MLVFSIKRTIGGSASTLFIISGQMVINTANSFIGEYHADVNGTSHRFITCYAKQLLLVNMKYL